MKKQLFFLETYGCQMNFSDSEIIASVMNEKGFEQTDQINQADIIFVNTCSIRENAEQAQTLATLRDTLLPRLISGKLRMPEAQKLS